jgi:REP element-mobilizing transposase RayT
MPAINNNSEMFPEFGHRRSIRQKEYNYGSPGVYAITICVKNRECAFGEISNGMMSLSKQGIVADILWCEIPQHEKNIKLHEYVIMPNHLHAILEITRSPGGSRQPGNACVAPTNHNIRTRYQNQGKHTLSSIIGSYKSAVTKHLHRLGFIFAWQRNFYEQILLNSTAYGRMRDYIQNNPLNWAGDALCIKNWQN